MKSIFLFLISVLMATPVVAKIKIVVTTTDLREIAKEVGGDEVEVETLCKGAQDPHFIESKPSFMVKASKADLFIAIGLGLESGWVPNILRGARNPKVGPGQTGYFEIGSQLNPIEKLTGSVSRAQGDVHPEGNPHVLLDPVRAGHAAMLMAERLSKIDESKSSVFTERAKKFQDKLDSKTKEWQKKLESLKVRKVVTYHKTLSYFLDRFKIENVGTLEPKPGIPPTANHILGLIKLIRSQQVKHILVENYFDSKVAERIKDEVPTVEISSVPVAVEGREDIRTLELLYENLVKILAEKEK